MDHDVGCDDGYAFYHDQHGNVETCTPENGKHILISKTVLICILQKCVLFAEENLYNQAAPEKIYCVYSTERLLIKITLASFNQTKKIVRTLCQTCVLTTKCLKCDYKIKKVFFFAYDEIN